MESPGCNLVCSDHPSNTKRGDIFLYYKNCLPLRIRNTDYLRECLNFQVIIGDKSCNPWVWKLFWLITLKLLHKLWPKKFFSNDNYYATTNNRYSVMITWASKLVPLKVWLPVWIASDSKKATHSLQNSSSYIDIIFTSQLNIAAKSSDHQIFVIKLHFLNLTRKSFIHHHMYETFGTLKRRTLILSDK